ncbi:MAG TPA: double-strand break repair helicase AddA [Hyphomicrobiaceae bacterium]|nr:double-strand break repair helicase AddA [Hyphomicrobiaceae bacterium]
MIRVFGTALARPPKGEAADRHATLRAETLRNQSLASDPTASAWVSANAGTGKTHVLTNRVLRLLLAGTPAERILALTYTKAAAAEMAKRVFQRLAEWTTAADAELDAKLTPLLGRAPTGEDRRLARQLLARTIETPGGLKVETIHAFCERLLKRFPLEAGVAPNFTILDDQQRQGLITQAVDEMLGTATSDKAGPLWSALKGAIAYAVDGNFERLLAEAFGFGDGVEAEADDADLAAREAQLRARLGVRQEATPEGLAQELGGLLSEAEMRDLIAALRLGGKTDQDRAEDLERALGATSTGGRVAAMEACFLTQGKTPRARLATREGARPDLAAQLSVAQARFVALHREQMALTVVEATLALAQLSADTLARYRAAKARLAVLDFDDLIAKAASLLRSSAAVEWVLFKLDGGLDHILVDEAQDTSPVQWQVIRSLAAEFFAGAGAREQARTLFAVGDEKQSIYGFQGAAPTMFAEAGSTFAAAARGAGRSWRQIPLTLSFRTVEPLLGAVDQIFATPTRTPGVSGPDKPVAHVAHRFGHAGVLEIWPLEKAAPTEATPAWAPLDEASATHPVTRLAARIADTIKRWLETGERLASEDRPVRAGDILILVRKRVPFAPAMVSALKARRIPVAGADRLILTEQIAVQDLIALGEVSLLPEDDLALAALLKSPLFDLTDEHLISLAPGRAGSLWQALIERGTQHAFWRSVADRLLRWQGEARQLAPFDFYAGVLDRDGMRARMLARLGSEAADPLDEFLNQALAYEAAGPPSLQGFLLAMGQARPEIKRDMEQGRDEVRVMTVHGAKGLEAPIVFLPDTCSTRSGRWPGSLLAVADAEAGLLPPFLWPVRGTSAVAAVDAARQAERQADKKELDRLLYVALTRARDRLYVAGFEGTREAPADCWYHLVRLGLEGRVVETPVGEKRSVWRLESAQTVAPQAMAQLLSPSVGAVQAPAWMGRRAPAEADAGVPLRPSQLAPLEDGAAGTKAKRPPPRAPSVLSPHALLEEGRFLRGTLTHALLEHLPAVGRENRLATAAALLASRAPDLDIKIRSQIIAETLTVLEHPELSALFGPDSRAEVPIVATLPSRNGAQPPLRLAGKIDRLVHTGTAVLIVDYKTNRPPPRVVAEVAETYLLQLAAYRLGVAAIFPGLEVRAALLWTDGARIMEIPRLLLDQHAQRLWTGGLASLDA